MVTTVGKDTIGKLYATARIDRSNDHVVYMKPPKSLFVRYAAPLVIVAGASFGTWISRCPGTAMAENRPKYMAHLVMGLTIAILRNLQCSRYTNAAVDPVQHSKTLHTKDPPSSSSNSAAKACSKNRASNELPQDSSC